MSHIGDDGDILYDNMNGYNSDEYDYYLSNSIGRLLLETIENIFDDYIANLLFVFTILVLFKLISYILHG